MKVRTKNKIIVIISIVLALAVGLRFILKQTNRPVSKTHNPTAFVDAIKHDANRGKKVYDAFCANCHAEQPLINLGAPRIHQENDWVFRQKKGMKAMLQLTSNGLNKMPPRGGCFECDDDLLLAAIKYMLPK